MVNIVDAILSLDPNARVKVIGEDYNQITWYDNNPNNISVTQIKTKKAELDAVDVANEYKMQREKEYPSIGDQLDALYHANVFPSDMASKIQAVKNKYPKPSE
jgi:hypothetical protein